MKILIQFKRDLGKFLTNIEFNRFLRERAMASTPKMEYQVFLCIFQKNSAMATLGLKDMGKFLW